MSFPIHAGGAGISSALIITCPKIMIASGIIIMIISPITSTAGIAGVNYRECPILVTIAARFSVIIAGCRRIMDVYLIVPPQDQLLQRNVRIRKEVNPSIGIK